MPIGIPTSDTINASPKTIRLSCFLVAPTDDNSPNCFVLSPTDIENALYIIDTEATTIISINMTAITVNTPATFS